MADERRRRILHIKDFFEQNTDEDHGALISEIANNLKRNGIEASNDTIREDIEALITYGLDIQLDDNGKKWQLLEREFEFVEIRLLIDCIASAKFLPENITRQLIDKLKKLVSMWRRMELRMYSKEIDPIKSTNNAVMYNIDTIHTALSHHKPVEFKYFQYNAKKERVLQDNGKVYHVDPDMLYYDNNYCYFQAFENWEKRIYRVDKMVDVKLAEDKIMDIDEEFELLLNDEPQYNLTHQEKKAVQILFNNDMMDAVIDRYGESIEVENVDAKHFRAKIELVPDLPFFAWIFELGDKAMIEYPLAVVAQMMDILKERHKAYREEHSRNVYYYRRKNNKTNQEE